MRVREATAEALGVDGRPAVAGGRTPRLHQGTGGREWSLGLLAAVWGLLAVVLLAAPVPVSLDGPSHVASAQALRGLLSGDPAFAGRFVVNTHLGTNWISGLLLSLVTSAVPAGVLIKAMSLLLFGALLAGAAFAARRIDGTGWVGENLCLVLLALTPIGLTAFLTWGFWNFLISSALMMVVIGLLLGEEIPSSRVTITLLSALAYLAHPVPVALTALLDLLRAAGRSLDLVRGAAPRRLVLLAREAFRTALPWFIPLCLSIGFVRGAVDEGFRTGLPSFVERVELRIRFLTSLEWLQWLSPSEIVGGLFAIWLAPLFAAIALGYSRAPTGLRASLRSFFALTLLLYLVSPDGFRGGHYLPQRLLFLLVSVAGITGICAFREAPSVLVRVCAILAAAVSLGWCTEYWVVSRRMAPAVAELRLGLERAGVPRGASTAILSYRLNSTSPRWPLLERTHPEWHWALLATTDRGLVALNDYQAFSDLFPVRYVSSHWRGAYASVDLSKGGLGAWRTAVSGTSNEADVIVTWGVPSGSSAAETWLSPPLHDTLPARYERVAEVSGVSRVEIWRRRGF